MVTIRKGEVKTVKAFIENFNAIGANMKALSVSAYKFLTDENVETRKEFKIKCMDELHMSKTTLSFLKTAGWLYLLDTHFYEFPYTNVAFFKKAIEYFENKNGVKFEIGSAEIFVEHMLQEIAKYHNPYCSDVIGECVDELTALSQKELKNLIDKYVSHETSDDGVEVETTDESDDAETSDDGDVAETSDEEIEEVNSHMISLLDDDINNAVFLLKELTDNDKITKQAMKDSLQTVIKIMEGWTK